MQRQLKKDSFLDKKKTVAAAQPETRIDDNRLYYEVAGGLDKRGHIYGTGKAMYLYFDRASRHSLTGERDSYAPELLTKMSQENAANKVAMEAMSARLNEFEEYVISQRESRALNTQSPPTYNLGGDIFGFDVGNDTDDEDFGVAGTNVPPVFVG